MAQVTGSIARKKAKRTSYFSLADRKAPRTKTLRGPNNIGKISRQGVPPSFPVENFLNLRLTDPAEAIGYLNACLEEDNAELFLLALKDVIRAQGGMAKISKKTNLNREGLYDMLSKNGNPRLSSLEAILEAIGLKLLVAPRNSV